MRALVTGATGFVGSILCEELARRGAFARAAIRRSGAFANANETCVVADINGKTDWSRCLDGIDTVFHLAGKAHAFGGESRDSNSYRTVNVDGTIALARAAIESGVRSFVFVSSVKVNGDVEPGRAFVEDDAAAPGDVYARSKWEAEEGLRALDTGSGMTISIVRPPLVYGPGVKANFYDLLQAVDRRRLLPLGAIHNERSLISARNLSDALIALASRNRASGTFFVSDRDDVSTPELVRRMAGALGVGANLVSVPPTLLKFAGALTGKGAAIGRLLGSLRVNPARIETAIGWRPAQSLADGLRETVEWYRTSPRE